MEQHEIYKAVILDGCAIEFGELCLCPIDVYYKHNKDLGFQVHCDHSKTLDKSGHPYSVIFDKLDKAIEKFLELKEYVYGS